MAQTKRKRRSKHRGTAAGNVQSRGRTGRRPTEQERKATKSQDAKERREARLNQPPSWRSAITRAALASVFFFVIVLVGFHQPVSRALAPAIFALAIYVPLGYYTDLFLYRRRQKRKAGSGAAAAPERSSKTSGARASGRDGKTAAAGDRGATAVSQDARAATPRSAGMVGQRLRTWRGKASAGQADADADPVASKPATPKGRR